MCYKLALSLVSLVSSLSIFEMNSSEPEVSIDLFPYLKVYKDGTVHRIAGTDVVAAGLDPETGVLSKDIVIIPETGVSVRLYRPNLIENDQKLPLLVYYHGGAFVIASIFEPRYHTILNKLVAEANIILVSVDYRLAPEYPLPIAYEDSWDALKWVASHAKRDGGHEAWLKDYVDFDQVFLAGDSAGANIAHHMALKDLDLKMVGVAMIHPYFWGKDPIGLEIIDRCRREMVDKWWMFVCPSDKGSDDPHINPFVDGAPSVKGWGCDRVLVMVAEKDILSDRAKLYYDKLVKCGWQGKVEIMETQGEDHVFHIFNPNCEKAKNLIKLWASFINQGKAPVL